jgi:SSS family solute:Na+ symporter
VFAALIAAIVSSLASMMNSISTIFTMDIYADLTKVKKTESQLVTVGRLVSLSAIVLASIIARPLLGNFDQAFQYIQEFTGFFTPGIVVIFFLAMFWKKATANAAIAVAISSAVISLALKLLWPALPFIDRVGLVFLLCAFIGLAVSHLEGGVEQPGAIEYKDIDTTTSASFNLASAVIVLMLVGLYATWW